MKNDFDKWNKSRSIIDKTLDYKWGAYQSFYEEHGIEIGKEEPGSYWVVDEDDPNHNGDYFGTREDVLSQAAELYKIKYKL